TKNQEPRRFVYLLTFMLIKVREGGDVLGLVFVEHKKRETEVSQKASLRWFYYLFIRIVSFKA
ncbi:hypothetical protein, partial [Vibrio sp. F12]|uniref:hypothetical protein n=2 Tax=Vibrio sp. F12 TaxID=2070776 RepID=UPI0019D054DD